MTALTKKYGTQRAERAESRPVPSDAASKQQTAGFFSEKFLQQRGARSLNE